jgi:hypothetical protein
MFTNPSIASQLARQHHDELLAYVAQQRLAGPARALSGATRRFRPAGRRGRRRGLRTARGCAELQS